MSPLVGRVGAVVKATVEQASPVDEALLGDLTLEHQLRDRAIYLRALAEAAKDSGVSKLAERIQKAHEATIEWLTTCSPSTRSAARPPCGRRRCRWSPAVPPAPSALGELRPRAGQPLGRAPAAPR